MFFKRRIIPADEPTEWIWVEGYKGTHQDMSCLNESVQFQVGGVYEVNGEPDYGRNGFRLSLILKDVFIGYPFNFKNRYFKVRALVRKKDIDEYGGYICFGDSFYFDGSPASRSFKISQLAAKKIEFVEEVPREDVYELVKDNLPMIDSLEEFLGITDYGKFIREKVHNALDQYLHPYLVDVIVDRNSDDEKLKQLMDFIVVLGEQGMSKDMLTYFALARN